MCGIGVYACTHAGACACAYAYAYVYACECVCAYACVSAYGCVYACALTTRLFHCHYYVLLVVKDNFLLIF